MEKPFFTNDAVIFGILMLILMAVFTTAANPRFQKFYRVVPTVLLCYFIPSLLNSFGLVDVENSKLYYVASRFLLPACLVLLTVGTDFKAISRLGFKALVMFFTASVGIIIGGPIALWIVATFAPGIIQVDGVD